MSNDQPVTPTTSTASSRASAKAAHASFTGSQKVKKLVVAATAIGLTAAGVAAPVKPQPAFPEWLIDTGINCDMTGASLKKPLTDLDKQKNPLKNRYEVPERADIDPKVAIDDFLNPDIKVSAFPSTVMNEEKAASLTGYIVKIEDGGSETCNCQTITKTYFDTHIYLSKTDPSNRPPVPKGQHDTTFDMIVEVTPRMRQIMKPNSTEWNTNELKKAFPRGTKVNVTGWQFYDREHEPASYNIKHVLTDWRFTCWELHPVTAIDKMQ